MLWRAPSLWYYKQMRRLAVVIGALLLLTACGKKTRVSVPNPPAPRATPTATDLEGLASYYREPYHGRPTANGEIFDTYKAMTAAHRTLPFNTVVRVTNKSNGKQVDVRINDRGPFVDGRVIDLSLAAALKIDMVRAGTAPVRLAVVKAVSAQGRTPATPIYAVQVGAFENQSAAESLRRELKERYGEATIQKLAAGKTLYRVRVGYSPDMQTAQKLATRLRAERFDPFVVRLD
jgi:rare lipoprotein A